MRAPLSSLLAFVVAAAAVAACGVAESAGPDADPRAPRDPQACYGCHAPDYMSADGHVGKRPTTCGVCHTTTRWGHSPIDHAFWPLTGAHEKVDCFRCHEGTPPVFRGTSKECVGCHRKDYERAPNHVGRRPTTCEECHSTDAWKPAHEDRRR